LLVSPSQHAAETHCISLHKFTMAPKTRAAKQLQGAQAQKRAKISDQRGLAATFEDPDLAIVMGILTSEERYDMTLPTSARTMLAACAPLALSDKNSQPHEYMGQVNSLIASTLEDAKIIAAGAVDAAEAEVGVAQRDLEASRAVCVLKADAVSQANATAIAKQEALDAAQAAVAKADVDHDEAVFANERHGEERRRLEHEKEAASEVLFGSFHLLVESPGQEDEVKHKLCSAIQLRLKALCAEAALVAAVPRSLGKEQRTEFDTLAIDHVRAVLEKDAADCNSKLAMAAKLEEELSAETLGASAVLDLLISRVTSISQSLVEMRLNLSDSMQEHTVAEAAVADHATVVEDRLSQQESMIQKRGEVDEAVNAFERLAARRREYQSQRLSNLGC